MLINWRYETHICDMLATDRENTATTLYCSQINVQTRINVTYCIGISMTLNIIAFDERADRPTDRPKTSSHATCVYCIYDNNTLFAVNNVHFYLYKTLNHTLNEFR